MHDLAEISGLLVAEHEHAATTEAAAEPGALCCPVCAGRSIVPMLQIRAVPVFCNVLWPTREQALSAATADIALSACGDCGHVFNAAFDVTKVGYSAAYENSLHFSQHFSAYAASLAAHLVETYDIRNKDVIDVGCGRGDFLSILCSAGSNRGYGFDKSYAPNEQGPAKPDGLTFVRDFFGEQYAGYPCDLLCCRHVLEHIERPNEFVAGIRRALSTKRNVIVFFEVPNSANTLRDLGIWDLIYEHCSYFNSESLQRVFAHNGFTVLESRELYDGQFLGITCSLSANAAAPASERSPAPIIDCIDGFPQRFHDKLAHWQGVVSALERTNKRAVVWGGGSKGVTLLNLLRPACVAGVIDVNPRKHGRYIPGTGHEILPPSRLPEIKPDVVIIMNDVYRNEIIGELRAMGLAPEVLSA